MLLHVFLFSTSLQNVVFGGFPLRWGLWLLMEIVDLGNFGRLEGNVDDDLK